MHEYEDGSYVNNISLTHSSFNKSVEAIMDSSLASTHAFIEPIKNVVIPEGARIFILISINHVRMK